MTRARPVAWILELDAEYRWIDPDHRSSTRLRATVRELAARLRAALAARPGEPAHLVVAPELDRLPPPGTHRVEAWSPSAAARELAARLGDPLDASPTEQVLATVNHRRFAADCMEADDLPGACFVERAAEVLEILARDPERSWLLKRPFGFSGRMRKVVPPGAVDAATRTWIEASEHGYGEGLQVEPLVTRELDIALHGRIRAAAGGVRFAAPTVSRYTAEGAWMDARPLCRGELELSEQAALERSGERVAAALAEAGYHGPFGIDAFRWRDSAGRRRFRALVEINARHTMAGLFAGDLDVLLDRS